MNDIEAIEKAGDIWSALPYRARESLVSELTTAEWENSYPEVDRSHWTNRRIQVTPWSLLTDTLRKIITAELAI